MKKLYLKKNDSNVKNILNLFGISECFIMISKDIKGNGYHKTLVDAKLFGKGSYQV